MPSSRRLLLAKLVHEHRCILFAPFSLSITKKVKEELWEQIRKEAIAHGYTVLANRNWREVRDNHWAAMRRDFLQKRERYKKSTQPPYNEVFNFNCQVLTSRGIIW
jgi:hypothetical protein